MLETYLEVIRGKGASRTADDLTPPVEMLIRLIGAAGELGNTEIREQLGLKDRTHLRDRYLNPSLLGGWIEMTIPDKPNSRLQRYRLTAKGRDILKLLDSASGAVE